MAKMTPKMSPKMAMKKYEGSAADKKADMAGAKKMMAGKPSAPAKGKGKMPAFLMGKGMMGKGKK